MGEMRGRGIGREGNERNEGKDEEGGGRKREEKGRIQAD